MHDDLRLDHRGPARRVGRPVGDGIRKRGCLFTLVVGVIGAFIGGALFRAVGSDGDVKGVSLGSVSVAFIGGCVLCLLLKVLDRS